MSACINTVIELATRCKVNVLRTLQLWSKLLQPTMKLQLDPSNPTAEAVADVRMLRTRIKAIASSSTALQTCLQKGCEGLKAKLKPGPMCTALQQLLTGAHRCH